MSWAELVLRWEPWTYLLEVILLCARFASLTARPWLTHGSPTSRLGTWRRRSAPARAFTDDDDDGPQTADMDVISATTPVIGSLDLAGVLHLGPMTDMAPAAKRFCLEARISAF